MDVKHSDHKITSKPDFWERFPDAKHRENRQHISYNSHTTRFNSVLKSYTTMLVKQEYAPESECEEVFEMTIDIEDIKNGPLDDENFEVAQNSSRKWHTELLSSDRVKKKDDIDIVPGYPGILYVRRPGKQWVSDSGENSYKKPFPQLQTTETTGTSSTLEKEQCLSISRDHTSFALLGIKSNNISYSFDKQNSLGSAAQGENNFSGQMTTVKHSKTPMKFEVNTSKMSTPEMAKVVPCDLTSNGAENNIQKKRSAKLYLHKESKSCKKGTLENCYPKQLEVENGKNNLHLFNEKLQMLSSEDISGPNKFNVPPKMKILAESKANNIEQFQLPSKRQSLSLIEIGDSDKETSQFEHENNLCGKALDIAAQAKNYFSVQIATVKDNKTSVKVSSSEMATAVPCGEISNRAENNIQKKKSTKPSLHKESKRFKTGTLENCYPKQLEVNNRKHSLHLFDDKAQMPSSAEISGLNKFSVPPGMKSLAESKANNIEQFQLPSKEQSLSSVKSGDSDKDTSQFKQENNLCGKTLDFAAQGKNNFSGQIATVKDNETSVKVNSSKMANVVPCGEISNETENDIQKMRSTKLLHEESKRFKTGILENCYPKQLEVDNRKHSLHLFDDNAQMPNSAEISGPNKLSVIPKTKSLAESKANDIEIEQIPLPSKGQSLSSVKTGDSQLEQLSDLCRKPLDDKSLSTPNVGNSKARMEKDRLPHQSIPTDYTQSDAKVDAQVTFSEMERVHLGNEANGTEKHNFYTNNISGYSVPSHSYHACDSGSYSQTSVPYHDYPARTSKSYSKFSQNVDRRFSQSHKGQCHQNEASNIYCQETTKASVNMLNNNDVQQSVFSYNNHYTQPNRTHPPVSNRGCFNLPFRPVHNFQNFHSYRMPLLPQPFRIPFLPNRFPPLAPQPSRIPVLPNRFPPLAPQPFRVLFLPNRFQQFPRARYDPVYPPPQQTNSNSSDQRC